MCDARPTPDRTRREGVRASPIPLADGRAWGLALPTHRLRPEFEAGVDALGRPTETVRVVAEFGYPLEVRRLVDDLRSACEAGSPGPQYEALFTLAVALLRRAHDLGPAEAAALFESDVDDLPGLVDAVLAVVTGGCPEETPGPPGKDSDDARPSRIP